MEINVRQAELCNKRDPTRKTQTKKINTRGTNVFSNITQDQKVKVPRRLRKNLNWKETACSKCSPFIPQRHAPDLRLNDRRIGEQMGLPKFARASERWFMERTMETETHKFEEMKTVHIALQREMSLENKAILVMSDNTATVTCINKQGSTRSQKLQEVRKNCVPNPLEENNLNSNSYTGNADQWADRL